jgi:uncharacterized protein involved in exopolysaccharide biosynthesis
MTSTNWRDSDEISLFGLGTAILRHRWRIIRWMIFGGAVAALFAIRAPALYVASTSFVPLGQPESNRSGLATIAGQFGVTLPTTGQPTLSPDFYVSLLQSRELLGRIARDSIVVVEMRSRRIPFLDLVEISGESARGREEQGVKLLKKMIRASATKATGVVEVTVATRWPSVSVAIADALINELNDFNQRMRKEQAAAERKFVEGRLAVAGSDLRAAEDRLETFLQTNRQFASSPDLSFQRDRLQRDVTLKQQVFTSLTQSYEEVRLREVRDTPVITVVESPSVPSLPEPRRRIMSVLLGLLVGGVCGLLLTLISEKLTRRRNEGDIQAREFAGTLGEIKDGMRGRARWLGERIRR